MKFVGWDWASTSHDVTVLNEQGKVVERWALRHTEQALGATCPPWPAGRAPGGH
jgi:hypothetical protein